MDKVNYAPQGIYNTQAAIQNLSEGIITRLSYIRSSLTENTMSALSAADKIVGPAPTPINANPAARGDHPPACCFLDSLQQILTDIEHTGTDMQEHLNRLHRAF